MSLTNSITIQANKKGRLIDFNELRDYRDLFFFLVWRDIKVLYAQTVFGFAWAIVQPVVQIALFTLVFDKVAKIPTDGIPYVLFVAVGVIPWTYMSTAMTTSSQSLLSNTALLGKIYFPRVIFPVIPILAKLVDFSISLVIILVVLIYYDVSLSLNLLFIPLFVLMMMLTPLSVGMWLSALAIRYRDVKFAIGFFLRMLMYTAPIVYSASSIPEQYRLLYSLNPIVGVIEGFRASLLGLPIPWMYIFPGMIVSIVLLITGIRYFRKMEQVFVDVI